MRERLLFLGEYTFQAAIVLLNAFVVLLAGANQTAVEVARESLTKGVKADITCYGSLCSMASSR